MGEKVVSSLINVTALYARWQTHTRDWPSVTMIRRQLVGGTASAAISQGYLAPRGLEIVRVVEDNDAYAPSRISRARGKGDGYGGNGGGGGGSGTGGGGCSPPE